MKKQTQEQLNKTGFTKYIEMRKCVNCEKINDNSLSKCSCCGMVLFEVATDDEIKEYQESRQKKAELLN